MRYDQSFLSLITVCCQGWASLNSSGDMSSAYSASVQVAHEYQIEQKMVVLNFDIFPNGGSSDRAEPCTPACPDPGTGSLEPPVKVCIRG
jgi:hypothetical protein